MNRALISGITGGVGQAMARQLLNAGVDVHGLSRQEHPALRAGLDDVNLHRVDGTTDSLVALFKEVKPETVFHLAALARREHLTTDVTPFINANILFGSQLLEGAKAIDCRRFISAGSYLQHAEGGEYHPFNLYAATKNAFEDVLAFYADAYLIAAVVVTVCNAYSEYDSRPTLLSDMAVAVARDKPLQLHAEEAWVDLVHVEDVAGAFIQAADLFDTDAIRAGVVSHYSASAGRVTSSTELVEIFERIGERKLTIKRGTQRHPARRGKPWHGECVPGWTPGITLDEGVKRFIERARQGAWGTS